MMDGSNLNPGFHPGDVVEIECLDRGVGVVLFCYPSYAEVRLPDGTYLQISYHMLRMVGLDGR